MPSALTTTLNLATQGINLGTAVYGWNNLLTGSGVQQLTLTLGRAKGVADITFLEFELPEKFGPVGGSHEVCIHEFPGGTRVLQALGPFAREITWSGILIGYVLGASAFERAITMDRFRVLGTQLFLNYAGVFEWSGVLKEWKAVVRHQNMLEYTAIFEPDVDITEVNSQTALTAAKAQAQTPESLLSMLLGQLSSAFTSILPTNVTAALTGLSSTISAALLPAAGLVSAVLPADVSDIIEAGLSVGSLLTAFKTGVHSTLAQHAVACQLIGPVASIVDLFEGTIGTTNVQVQAVNADLPRLASQYYKDATQWQTIANANLLIDPLQTGIQTITIPNPTVSP